MNCDFKRVLAHILLLTVVGVCVAACAAGAPNAGVTGDQATTKPAGSEKTQQQLADEYVLAKKCGTLSVGDINYPEKENSLHPGWYRSADCAAKK